MTVRLFCFNKNDVSFVLNIYNNISLHVIVFTGLKNGEVKHSIYGAANLFYRSFYVGPQSYNGEKFTSHISHVKLWNSQMASLLNEFLQAFSEKSIISWYGRQQFRTNAMNKIKIWFWCRRHDTCVNDRFYLSFWLKQNMSKFRHCIVTETHNPLCEFLILSIT